METLNDEKILHIASLAHLSISNEEVNVYKEQLNKIMNEINKIEEVSIKTDDIMITSSNNKNCYKEDNVGIMNTKEEIFKNAKNNDSEYIIVPKVLND